MGKSCVDYCAMAPLFWRVFGMGYSLLEVAILSWPPSKYWDSQNLWDWLYFDKFSWYLWFSVCSYLQLYYGSWILTSTNSIGKGVMLAWLVEPSFPRTDLSRVEDNIQGKRNYKQL